MKVVSKYALFLLSMLLLLPGVVKLAHVFADHEHYNCDHYSESHFHDEFPDCDIFTFQQAPITSLFPFNYELISPEESQGSLQTSYCFLNDYQELPFALRGPPNIV